MSSDRPPLHTQAIRLAFDVANGRSPLSKFVPLLLLAADAVLCGLVIWKVPYTEIDWVAYMEHISQFVNGERDYTKFMGGTGPLVYPAVHVYIYTGLYYITDKGTNILLAQQLFAGLYMVTLAVVMACYGKAKTPPYLLPLLILSKRLHSIFLLRCFNDCFAVLFLFAAILALQHRQYALGALIYSLGLGTKMSLLLVLPALGSVLLLGRGVAGAVRLAVIIAQLQIGIALPFLGFPREYWSKAFELSRRFMWKWTVNWRFLGEEAFNSTELAVTLLVLHATLLVAFITQRWLRPLLARKSIPDILRAAVTFSSPLTEREEAELSGVVDPRYVMTTMLGANVLGLLCARSLHYQFYAYLAWTTPYLLWRGGMHPVGVYGFWAAQEWAWNVYPSTPASSAVVVGVLAVTVGVVWAGAKGEYRPIAFSEASKAAKGPKKGVKAG